MSHPKFLGSTLACLLLGFASSALAHPLHPAASFMEGALHPFSGLYHLLAAVAVGLWAAQQGLRWLLPIVFLVVMLLGMGLAGSDVALPAVEPLTGALLLMLCWLLAWGALWPAAVSMSLVVLFALFHGYAHGLEMAAQTSWPVYVAGITLATGVLHGAGVASGLTIRSQAIWRSIGCVIVSTWVWSLATV